jgi:hypothetical protein
LLQPATAKLNARPATANGTIARVCETFMKTCSLLVAAFLRP